MTGYVRRRFHLIQGGNPQLWLIHYLRAPDEGLPPPLPSSNDHSSLTKDCVDRLPVSQAPPPPQPYPPRPFPLPKLADVTFTLSTTDQLVSFKNPAATWPPPPPVAQQMSAPPPQQQHYTPQGGGGGPPTHFMGRQHPQQVAPPTYRPQQVPPSGNKRVKVEEEEDEEVFMPRDVAAQRFVRWTEWMEEILSSGYHIRTSPSSPHFPKAKVDGLRRHFTPSGPLGWDSSGNVGGTHTIPRK